MTTQTPDQNPSSRIALVTGGNRGLGRSSVLALAASGTDVVLTYRAGEEQAAAVVAEVAALGRRAVALQLDTTEPDTFVGFVATLRATLGTTWGRETFDVLVNNAGFARATPLGGTDAATIAELVAVHLTGVVLLTQELVPLLVDGGRIINTSTGLARFTGDFGYSVYASVKGAVEVYTRYLAQELGPRRIAVNTIAPGATGTDFGGGSLRDDEAVRAHLGAVTAMGHVGEPDDVGAAVAALAGPGMGWVTGQRVEVSGGMNL
ncbi:SDR family oxidoreductase [Nocardioides sp. 1609]|uniref:SDR family NAD(P)-dependent oxidoreductase n=1 Tax=Nocardioides sp. 1609 TaxID=2508327 RepID=UPI00107068DD|nr:SDR family oxidoreductase [Nocardioides sp. 1609]